MGIVAYCPNDHRVKVKDNLAGKKGICPTCGARFRIPLESQPDRKHAAVDTPGPAADLFETPASPPPPASAPAAVPAHLSASGVPVAEIISFDANLAASLPRAMPLAASRQ
jgi:hypothetical protein